MGLIPNALVASPRKVTATTVANFISDARTSPGKISAATQGNGTTSHLAAAMFQMMAKVKFVLVPYRGSAPALQGLLAGDCDIMFDNLGVSLPLAKGGGLKLLAVGTERRMASLPDVPTMAETLPGFSSVTWMGIAAPPRTPRDIVTKISADIAEAIRSPEVRALRRALGGARRQRPRCFGPFHGHGDRALARRHQDGGRDAGVEASIASVGLPLMLSSPGLTGQ